jgi:hypothetical protein
MKTKVFPQVGLVVSALLATGCVALGGATASAPARAPTTLGTGYTVCVGGAGSRIPSRETIGHICRRGVALRDYL